MTDYLTKLLLAASDGALVLTSNKRLSRYLHTAFDQMMQSSGRQAWPTAQIFSVDGWLDRMFSELDLAWKLLPAHAEKRLWEQIIEQDSAGSEKELLNLAASADKASQASRLLEEYTVAPDDSRLSEDHRMFQGWHQRYQQLCAENEWSSRSALARQVIHALRLGQLTSPGHLLLAGFDQRNPLLEDLQRIVTERGGQVEDVLPDPRPGARIMRHACSDPHHEVQVASRWLRRKLEQGATSVGIVVTDLQGRRSQIERLLRDQIEPSAVLHPESQVEGLSLSLGSPLSHQGPIHAALEILAAGPRLSLDQLSFLLRSPYLRGGLSEADSRATFDRKLRSFKQPHFKLTSLLKLVSEESDLSARKIPAFRDFLEKLAEHTTSSRSRMPGEWASAFNSLLRDAHVGWPGERPVQSSEYQRISAWYDKLLPALASLDPVSRPIDRQRALSLLRRLATEIDFQLEASTGPVQVMGLLESAGLEFDHLWVMGVTEDLLPAAARPNPFLPVPLQVEHQMPHASAERELEFARQVIHRLKLAGRGEVVFSYAQREGDCQLRPSPLILALPEAEPLLAAAVDAQSMIQATAPDLEAISDLRGTELASDQVKGGTAILKDQALCPFRAFGHYRLGARAMEKAEPGLDAMLRGNLLHKSLELLWQELQSQQQLLQLDLAARSALIKQSVSRALEMCVATQIALDTPLLELERQRLEALIEEWVSEVELERGPFRVVQLEKKLTEKVGPLLIDTIVDRVDQLEDGRRVVLDYKTGVPRADLLLGERLLEPQLPIYALTDPVAEADAVAFAQMRRGACKLLGVSREEGMLPKVSTVEKSSKARELGLNSWRELLDHWRRQIEAAAEDFAAGLARVDPVDQELACKYCDLTGLCRIAESEQTGGEV